MNRLFGALLLLTLTSPTTAADQQPADADRRLTVPDVEKVSGLKGIQLVPRMSQAGAGGALNFADSDKHLVLMVNFGTADLYRHAREQKELKVGDTMIPMALYHADVKGLGDEAFDSPPGSLQYVLYIRKGNQAVSITTYVRSGGNVRTLTSMLTMEQLKQLAAIVVSRL
jgi:hypothetical protein